MQRRFFLKLAMAVGVVASGSLAFLQRFFWAQLAQASSRSGARTKVICLGLDGMDPNLLRQYMDAGVLPNFSRLVAAGDFQAFGPSIPPQSPVAWSNFITGQDPGGHGIFDFIHRDPETLIPKLSISEAKLPDDFFKLGKWKVPRKGGGVELLRRGRAFWEYLAEAGVDVTVFKVPSNFPPVQCDARTLAGMGTPDILGTYGIFSYFTDDPPQDTDIGGGRIVPVSLRGGRFTADIPGPLNTYQAGDPESAAAFTVVVDPVHTVAKFEVGSTEFVLQQGEWSDWVTLHYEMIPHLKEVTGICRFYLMQAHPTFRLYVSPVQIDPSDPEMPICTPEDYSRELVAKTGPFYTQGLPDDTKALDEGVFGDDDYIAQADLVLEERMQQFRYELDRFHRLDQGFLFFYFNSLDQNSHMFWRNMDPDSPLHADAGGRHADRIRRMYVALDTALGRTLEVMDEGTTLLAISDHGFAPYHRSFHVNTWLYENGYLALKPGIRPEDVAYLQGIAWQRTRAYALGINCLYLNMRGRERRGIVATGSQRDELLQELVVKLEQVIDPETGRRAIKHAYRADQVYTGPHAAGGPDIVMGYFRGFRGSNETALGEIAPTVFADNLLKWSGDHCIAHDEVPGIIVSNRKIAKEDPSLLDMAPTILRLFGLEPAPEMLGRDVFAPSTDA